MLRPRKSRGCGGNSEAFFQAPADFECRAGEEIAFEIEARSLHFFYEGERIGS